MLVLAVGFCGKNKNWNDGDISGKMRKQRAVEISRRDARKREKIESVLNPNLKAHKYIFHYTR
jgi:hypothetical protein